VSVLMRVFGKKLAMGLWNTNKKGPLLKLLMVSHLVSLKVLMLEAQKV